MRKESLECKEKAGQWPTHSRNNGSGCLVWKLCPKESLLWANSSKLLSTWDKASMMSSPWKPAQRVEPGYIKPQVVDGFSEEPIEGATVVIPETNTSYKTDEMGYTPDIRIEIVPDIRFKNINPKTWGEATLIAYKEGYIEYVLLNINIWESQNRQGPKIRLFPKENQQLDQPMSIVEGA